MCVMWWRCSCSVVYWNVVVVIENFTKSLDFIVFIFNKVHNFLYLLCGTKC